MQSWFSGIIAACHAVDQVRFRRLQTFCFTFCDLFLKKRIKDEIYLDADKDNFSSAILTSSLTSSMMAGLLRVLKSPSWSPSPAKILRKSLHNFARCEFWVNPGWGWCIWGSQGSDWFFWLIWSCRRGDDFHVPGLNGLLWFHDTKSPNGLTGDVVGTTENSRFSTGFVFSGAASISAVERRWPRR